jgi:hypothetical protein
MKEHKNIPFEEALARLETIVAAMEKGDVPLAELVSNTRTPANFWRGAENVSIRRRSTVERLRSGAATEPFKSEDRPVQDGASD